jgi:Baseplate J-like protein
VTGTSETIWDAHPPTIGINRRAPAPVPIPHTVLALSQTLDGTWGGETTVHFGWIAVGTLIDQPFGPWNGTPPATLVASGAQPFPQASGYQLLLQDANGIGIVANGSSNDGETLALGGLPDPEPTLQPPFTVLPNLLKVTRGKTVANEVLGSGDATNPGQSFRLKQSPVTYLQQGAEFASAINLTVGGRPWTEVASFYKQGPDATVFVTSEDDDGKTRVTFGDGDNGARLPTGTDNVVATYRIGAGAASPAAGKLTVITQSYPGLRAVLNPVAVGGGADADPPDKVRRYAPRSVLAFGRAVSVFDYEAIAALTPGVTRARAVWAWDDTRQRTLVTVYVGDDAAAAAAASTALAAAGDPNRPIKVVQATPVAIALALAVTMTPAMDPDAITAGVVSALTDPDIGLFGAVRAAIGQPVFDSAIEQAVLAVSGTVAMTDATFILADDSIDAGPLHDPGEGGYFTLAPADISLQPEFDTHGG